jgi:hypothetical protein
MLVSTSCTSSRPIASPEAFRSRPLTASSSPWLAPVGALSIPVATKSVARNVRSCAFCSCGTAAIRSDPGISAQCTLSGGRSAPRALEPTAATLMTITSTAIHFVTRVDMPRLPRRDARSTLVANRSGRGARSLYGLLVCGGTAARPARAKKGKRVAVFPPSAAYYRSRSAAPAVWRCDPTMPGGSPAHEGASTSAPRGRQT